MISAFAMLYQLTENEGYLYAARKAEKFIDEKLFEDGTLYVSFRDGSRGAKGYLDDYAFYAFALMRLYDATLDTNFINKARRLCDKAISDFFDMGNGGFYLYGKENEELIITPKEIYDGAIPSGNSVMAYNLIKLSYLTNDTELDEIIKKQLLFISSGARKYPSGHCFFLLALMLQNDPPETVTAVLKNKSELAGLRGKFGQGTIVRIVDTPTDEYRLINDKTTFYVCKNHVCMNPINDYTQTSSKLRI
ncbi:hypothetical protein SDC9_99702 [bioreactor metagenome]|uniref:Uncharacterized protein n=1 Tax=bioreactor metagenome TaxID=1076179 RepID=A0A645AJM1_9ZZZZ